MKLGGGGYFLGEGGKWSKMNDWTHDSIQYLVDTL